MPSVWMKEGGLRLLSGQERVVSVAALKIYLLLVASSGELSSAGPGKCRMTYSELEEGTGVSRTVIRPALDLLLPLIRTIGRSSYSLIGYPTDRQGGWCLMPAKHLMAVDALRAMGNDKTGHGALRLYYVILERRDVYTNMASISYDLISDYAGLRRADISDAIRLLQAKELVHVILGRTLASKQERGHNRYVVKGLPMRPRSDADGESALGSA